MYQSIQCWIRHMVYINMLCFCLVKILVLMILGRCVWHTRFLDCTACCWYLYWLPNLPPNYRYTLLSSFCVMTLKLCTVATNLSIICWVLETIQLVNLTLSQTMNFRLSQTVWRRQFKIWWKWQKVLKKRRKNCGKRRNCSLRAISPFPTMFSKDLYCRHMKTRACLGKG